jgi:hypothetical protein
MAFVIEDTGLVITVRDGAQVRFHNFTLDKPIFKGWVDHSEVVNMPGNRGRLIIVECVGVESLLDWAVVRADVTVAAGITLATGLGRARICGLLIPSVSHDG